MEVITCDITGDFALLHSRLTVNCAWRYTTPSQPPNIAVTAPESRAGMPPITTEVRNNWTIVSVTKIRSPIVFVMVVSTVLISYVHLVMMRAVGIVSMHLRCCQRPVVAMIFSFKYLNDAPKTLCRSRWWMDLELRCVTYNQYPSPAPAKSAPTRKSDT